MTNDKYSREALLEMYLATGLTPEEIEQMKKQRRKVKWVSFPIEFGVIKMSLPRCPDCDEVVGSKARFCSRCGVEGEV